MDVFGDIFWRLMAIAALGLATGFLSGLFGIGGGIVRIPLFIYLFPLFQVEQSVLMHLAIGTSVALVAPTALVATRKQIRLGNLDMSYYKTWAIGILLGVLVGTMLLPLVSPEVLKIIFAAFLLIVACYIGFANETVVISDEPPRGLLKIAISAAIGCSAALTGTGGGALTTPTLKAFSYPMKRAIALASASGLVIGVISAVGVVIQGWHASDRPPYCLGYVDLLVFFGMLPTTLIATPWGASVSNSMDKRRLRRVYTFLLFAIAADIIWKLYSAS